MPHRVDFKAFYMAGITCNYAVVLLTWRSALNWSNFHYHCWTINTNYPKYCISFLWSPASELIVKQDMLHLCPSLNLELQYLQSESVNCYAQLMLDPLDVPTQCRLCLYLARRTGALGTVLGTPCKGSSLSTGHREVGWNTQAPKTIKFWGFPKGLRNTVPKHLQSFTPRIWQH